jgi:membrane fusion protein, multidrug efflux system
MENEEAIDATPGTPAAAEVTHREPVLGKPKARRLFLIIGGVAAAILVAGGLYLLLTSGHESTDDAQVAADVVSLSARLGGQVLAVHVVENQPVKKGQPLVDIDPSEARIRVQQAEGDLATARAQESAARAQIKVAEAGARGSLITAQAGVRGSEAGVQGAADRIAQARAALARAEASAQKARLDYERASTLGGEGDIARAQVDTARAARDTAEADVAQARAAVSAAGSARTSAQAEVGEARGRLRESNDVEAEIAAARGAADIAHARVATAEAAVAQARLTLSYAHVEAPADGLAARLTVRVGQQVTVGQALLQLVPPQTYIVANFKETQVRRMRPGQPATIKVDALNQEFEGEVESLSGGTGAAFSLLPPDNASGNFVKVVQRVPVRIRWSGPTADRAPVGSSADVDVKVK